MTRERRNHVGRMMALNSVYFLRRAHLPLCAMEVQHADLSLREALRHIDWDADFATLFAPDTQSKKRRPLEEPSTDWTKSPGQTVNNTLQVSTTEATGHDALDNEWQEIAGRQRDQRAAAEAENRKLRRLLESEFDTARRVAAIASKSSAIGTALGHTPEPCIESYKGPQVDIQTHLERLGGLMIEAQAVFSAGQFVENTGQDFRDVAFKNLGIDGFMVELTASWILPFDIESVVQALWAQTTRVFRAEKATCFEDIYTAERTLVSRFVSEPKELGTIDASIKQPKPGASHGQIATRCDTPASDGSVVLVSNMEVKNFKPDGSDRSLVQGFGFLVVEPLSVPNAAPACRVKWCRRMQGRAPDNSTESRFEYLKWAQALTSGGMRKHWSTVVEQNVQAVENKLFDGTSL